MSEQNKIKYFDRIRSARQYDSATKNYNYNNIEKSQ